MKGNFCVVVGHESPIVMEVIGPDGEKVGEIVDKGHDEVKQKYFLSERVTL